MDELTKKEEAFSFKKMDSSRYWERTRPFIIISSVLVLWEFFAGLEIYPPYILPKFSSVVVSLYNELVNGELIANAAWSTARVLGGFFLGVLFAVPLGLAMGWSRTFESMVNPVMEALRPIPPLAWVPLAVIWLGLGMSSTIFITFIGAFFPILLSTIYGVKSAEKTTIEFAQTLGANDREVLYKVIIPYSLPSIFTGMRIAMGIAWMTVVAAEMIAAKFGLGYMIWYARHQFDTALIMGGMIVFGVLSMGMTRIMLNIENRLFAWRKGIVKG